MLDRRLFTASLIGTLAGTAVAPSAARGAPRAAPSTQLFYVSLGRQLLSYRVDTATRTLRQTHGPYSVAEDVQSCWQHPGTRHVYVASSDENTTKKGRHFLDAFRVDRTGALHSIGHSVPLAARPIYVTVDHLGRYVVTAYNRPAGITVHSIARDGSIGAEVRQPAALDLGIYPHQVRVLPSGDAVLVPARGNDARPGTAEDPGAVKMFAFNDGILANAQSVAPNGGANYRPRHAEFHPSGRWTYVVIESQNQVHTHALVNDRLSASPLFVASTLADPAAQKPGQLASAIQAHPGGRFLYVANRGTGTETFQNERVSNGGENSIAVFSIDPRSGEPRLIQSIDTRGIHARTFSLSSDAKWLVAGSIAPAKRRAGNRIETVPAGLTLFSVEQDGRLAFASKLDIDGGGSNLFWVGAIRY